MVGLKETYFAILDKKRELYPDAVFISVARVTPKNAKVDQVYLALAPSIKLITAYNDGKGISWEEYTQRYKKEIDNTEAETDLLVLSRMAEINDIFLVCYEKTGRNCHRHILLEILGAKPKTKQTTLF